MNIRIKVLVAAVAFAIAVGPLAARAVGLDPTIDGVVSVTPVSLDSRIAVAVTASAGETITGLRWFNNDGSEQFPEVSLVGATHGGLPDLDRVLVRALDVSGNSLGWSELDFGISQGTPDGGAFAVFKLPPFDERTHTGVGGGSGVGFRTLEGGPQAYLTGDGLTWIALSPKTQLAVEAITASGGAAKVSGNAQASPVSERVRELALLPAFPNPANPSTQIHFYLPSAGKVRLTVYSQRGARVRDLFVGELPSGEHLAVWTGVDRNDRGVASGIYFVKLHMNERTLTRRVVLVR